MSTKDHQHYYHFGDENNNNNQPQGRKRTNRDAFSTNPFPSKNAEATINLLEDDDDDSCPDNQQSSGRIAAGTYANINIITRINDLDVLKGRGAGVNGHFGNQQLNELVDSLKDEYWKTPKLQKMEMCRRVLARIHQRGGRFLQPIGCTNTEWSEITDEAAMSKISQCFRDRIKQEFDESTKKRPKHSACFNQNVDYISEATKIQNEPTIRVPQYANATKQPVQFEFDDAMANSSRVITPERYRPYHPQPRAKSIDSNTFNPSVNQGPLNVYKDGTHQQSSCSSSFPQSLPQVRAEKMQQQLIQKQTLAAEAQLGQHQQQQKHQNWKIYIDLSEKAIALEQKVKNCSSSNPQDNRSYSLLLENLKCYLLELEEQLNIHPDKSVASMLTSGSFLLSSLPGNGDKDMPLKESTTPQSTDTDGSYILTI